jgi:hypothetical protein
MTLLQTITTTIATYFYSSKMKLICVAQCVRKVMSTSVYKGMNPFNFIRNHFLQICL